MKYTQNFPKALRSPPAGEVSASARFLLQAGFIYKESAGLFTILPLGQRVLNKVNSVIRQKMAELEIPELTMPAISHIDRWKATGRENIDVLYKVPSRSGAEFVLNATTEELAAPMVKTYTQSYRDFPVTFYQICNKYRDELRAKSGILRGREFIMKDAYSFHTSKEDLDQFYDRVMEKYHEIYDGLGIGEKTLLTYAAGGDFSKYSHEFQTIAEIGEDTIYVCHKCKVAINHEIIHEGEICPRCGSGDLEKTRGIEVGNIFKLGTRFSTPLDLVVSMPDGSRVPIEMASYGIGCSRCIGAIAELHHDEKGLKWPKSVTPYDVHLLSVGKSSSYGESVYDALRQDGVDVLYDDRESNSAGEKFATADLIGIPCRVVASERNEKNGTVEVHFRKDGEKAFWSLDELKNALRGSAK
jgi:prolyl-tRNA synthetase